MAGIGDFIPLAEDIGIFQFYLPFVILFAVIYGMLVKTKIFGDPKDTKAINVVIALASSLFVMIYPTTGAAIISLTDFLANFFAGTLIFAVSIIAFLIVTFMILVPFSGEKKEISIPRAGLIALATGVILIVGLFIASGGLAIFPGLNLQLYTPSFYFGFVDPITLAIIAIVVLTALVIYWLVK